MIQKQTCKKWATTLQACMLVAAISTMYMSRRCKKGTRDHFIGTRLHSLSLARHIEQGSVCSAHLSIETHIAFDSAVAAATHDVARNGLGHGEWSFAGQWHVVDGRAIDAPWVEGRARCSPRLHTSLDTCEHVRCTSNAHACFGNSMCMVVE